ncbi:hypothetical protein NDU88_003887 [Pleurodeles waltl]|uniref:Uncharacterized protein n=1 Tax=Pleurodeles waltl TaxID=8319 RepID=A0AAV7UZQ2_PLEWA|nr:hypothetical protein NDU88_003887 [Pleurodeles waltl]
MLPAWVKTQYKRDELQISRLLKWQSSTAEVSWRTAGGPARDPSWAAPGSNLVSAIALRWGCCPQAWMGRKNRQRAARAACATLGQRAWLKTRAPTDLSLDGAAREGRAGRHQPR